MTEQSLAVVTWQSFNLRAADNGDSEHGDGTMMAPYPNRISSSKVAS